MAPEAKLIIRDQAGTKRAELVGDAYAGDHYMGGFWALQSVQEVNGAGLLEWTMDARKDLAQEIQNNWQVEYWRRDRANSIAWYREFDGIYRAREGETRDEPTFIGRAIDAKALLGWRHVLYKTGVANRSTFTSANGETIMKTLVQYNMTSSGTVAASRLRAATQAGAMSGFTITLEADSARGSTVPSWLCAQDNLLETLQKLARVAGGDFDLIKTGAATYEFRFYPGQRGTDRTATISFSTNFDNMVNPRYAYNRLGEKTVIIVGGQGQGPLRTFSDERFGDDWTATNDIEAFVAATNTSSSSALATIGDQKADQFRARETFDFAVRQAGKLYGRDYFLGDLTTAYYAPYNLSIQQQVRKVTISYGRDGAEAIKPEMRTL